MAPTIYRPSFLPYACARGSVQTEKPNSGFVEVGYISNAHGIRGEVSIKTSTDFSELRFATPGPRWLRQSLSHKESVKEVNLIAGREHPGQKSWIVRLEGIDSVEQAKQLVGSTMLVREDDKPEVEEGEYYSRDLIGMRVVLKETGELIGEVANVFDIRGTDLLQVRVFDGPPGRLIWVPFVEAIVPVVDVDARELRITPPKGLLELNTRSTEVPKRERRRLEWKDRKALQRRLSSVKKKLSELGQSHVFHGLKQGEKSDRSSLAEQIAGINTNLLDNALRVLQSQRETTGRRLPNPDEVRRYARGSSGNKEYAERGRELVAGGKVAVAVVVESGDESDVEKFVKEWDAKSAPLILVGDEETMAELTVRFEENEDYGFEKVAFVKEETMPVVGINSEIVMNSPFEIKEHSIGSFGVVTSLSKSLTDEIMGADVEYLWVGGCDGAARDTLVGLVDVSEADVGVVRSSDMNGVVLSVGRVKELAKVVETAPLEVVEVAAGEYGFRCDIVSAVLVLCSLPDLCVLDYYE